MELYLCFAPHGTLSGPVKSGLGKEITRLHIEATGARPESIHVVFQEIAVGCHFLGGKCDHRTTMVIANSRNIRSQEHLHKLTKSILAAWTRLTTQPEENLYISFNETDSATLGVAAVPTQTPYVQAR
jgi:phenylpyruvate tautomerase PptA (4-oxalocrotonate tautomerase family)